MKSGHNVLVSNEMWGHGKSLQLKTENWVRLDGPNDLVGLRSENLVT